MKCLHFFFPALLLSRRQVIVSSTKLDVTRRGTHHPPLRRETFFETLECWLSQQHIFLSSPYLHIRQAGLFAHDLLRPSVPTIYLLVWCFYN